MAGLTPGLVGPSADTVVEASPTVTRPVADRRG